MTTKWNKCKIGEVADVFAGQAAPQDPTMFSNRGRPFIRAGSLVSLLAGKNEDDLERIEDHVASAQGLRLFPAGTVLFAKSGMSALTGHVYRTTQPCYAVSHLAALLPNLVTPEFLTYWFVSHPPARLAGNSAYPSIRLSEIGDMEIVYPEDKDEQRRITALLDKADALRRERWDSLRLIDDLLRSTFLNLFGDPKNNPKGFPVRRLSEFYINSGEGTRCGPFGSALKKEELVASGVAVWNMDNIGLSGRMVPPFRMWISEEKYEELRSYSVQDGDIVISRAGTVGKMCVATMNGHSAIISTNLIRLRLGSALNPLYFVSLMTYCKGRVGRLKMGDDGAFTHMSTQVLDTLEFPYPPIELQNRFGSFVEKARRTEICLDQALAQVDFLVAALSQRAFRGGL